MSTPRNLDKAPAATALIDERHRLVAKLASLTEMIEQHRATIFLLERERMQLTTKLRLTEYKASTKGDA